MSCAAAAQSEPIRSPKLGKDGDAQAPKRQLKTPAGANGSAVRKPEPQPAEDGWQDF